MLHLICHGEGCCTCRERRHSPSGIEPRQTCLGRPQLQTLALEFQSIQSPVLHGIHGVGVAGAAFHGMHRVLYLAGMTGLVWHVLLTQSVLHEVLVFIACGL